MLTWKSLCQGVIPLVIVGGGSPLICGISLSQHMNLCLINMHINLYMRFRKLFPYMGCMGESSEKLPGDA